MLFSFYPRHLSQTDIMYFPSILPESGLDQSMISSITTHQ